MVKFFLPLLFTVIVVALFPFPFLRPAYAPCGGCGGAVCSLCGQCHSCDGAGAGC